MNRSNLKSTLAAAAVALALLAPAARAEGSRDTGVGDLIAAQGNAALREIRDELAVELILKFPAPAAAKPTPRVHARAAAQAASAPSRPKSTKVGA